MAKGGRRGRVKPSRPGRLRPHIVAVGEQGGEAAAHIPVLLTEAVAALNPTDGKLYVDATFGAGGYARAILEAADCRLIAFDRDPGAISGGAEIVAAFAPRLELRQQPFGALLDIAATGGFREDGDPGAIDGIVFDLGVSSMQLDQAERGFSFMADGPLDMRMFAAPGVSEAALATGEPGLSAADVVNSEGESRLANIIYALGEEKRSRAIAAAIVKRRALQPFERTGELVDVIVSVLGRGRPGEKHPATRTFQALRLYVNDELGELVRGLAAAELLLKPGGRLAVVTFHSLEDRIVKRFLAMRSGRSPGTSRHLPQQGEVPQSFRIVNSKPISPSNEEIVGNPRARSARLRVAERTVAAALGLDVEGRDAVALGVPAGF